MNDYIPPPPTTEGRRVTKTQLQAELRKEIQDEAGKLRRIINGRSFGRDVHLDQDEAAELFRKLESWAGRV